jgi:hypothetical protein
MVDDGWNSEGWSADIVKEITYVPERCRSFQSLRQVDTEQGNNSLDAAGAQIVVDQWRKIYKYIRIVPVETTS